MTRFSDIHDAFLFVSSDSYGINSAVLCKDTEKILYRSEMGGFDEIEEGDLDWDECIMIPHKNDLDLGQQLVFEFVEMYFPDDYDRVRHIFQKRGAYGRFKNFLESKQLIGTWYEFETQREQQALQQWCTENEIEISC